MSIGNLLNAYKKLIKKLLPTGFAWESINEDQVPLFDGMAAEYCRLDEKGKALLLEFDPGTATDLLVDWEQLLGLPDDCTPPTFDLSDRRLQARQKLAAVGGLSAPYFEGVAESLGFDAIVSDFNSFRVGRQRVGDPLTNPFDPATDSFRVGRNRVGEQLLVHGWRYCFEVNVEATTVEPLRVGTGRVGQPLVTFGNTILECTIAKLKPAHTCAFFTFRPVSP